MGKRKCRYCKEYIEDKSELFIIHETTSKGKEQKIFLHNKCRNEYEELMEYKKKEVKMFNEIYEYIKELLGYSEEQQLPNSLVTRLQDLRNGTILQRGVGRVVKSKEGYPYEVIFDTFLSCADNIRWALANKTFQKESMKINYIMAIIDSKVNDSYIQFKFRQDIEIIKKKNNVIEEEQIINQNKSYIKIENKPKSTGISRFLDDDEF